MSLEKEKETDPLLDAYGDPIHEGDPIGFYSEKYQPYMKDGKLKTIDKDKGIIKVTFSYGTKVDEPETIPISEIKGRWVRQQKPGKFRKRAEMEHTKRTREEQYRYLGHIPGGSRRRRRTKRTRRIRRNNRR